VPVDLANELDARAEKAEAAARDFAALLADIAKGFHYADDGLARTALERHPGWGDET
jgi:hypothetical protein